jgi:hypothetical protein
MVRNTLLESECRNHPYSILKQIIVDKLGFKNTAIIDPFAACLYSQGNSGIKKVFDTVFFLSVLDEHSKENKAHRTLPHPFHLLFRKGNKHNCLELKSGEESAFGPKKKFNELRQHINSQSRIGVPKMSIVWDTCRRRLSFFFEIICWYITNVDSQNDMFVVNRYNLSKRIVYIHNYSNVTFKDLSQWYSTMSDYVHKALCTNNADSIRNWKNCYIDFNSFMLDSTNKRDSASNKDRSELSGEETDDNLIDNNCDDDVEDDDFVDTVAKCDGNNKIADDKCDDDDLDTAVKCDQIADNECHKCMSSIRIRDDEIRYYHMCVGFGAHLKVNMIGNQRWGSLENQQVPKKKGVPKKNIGDTIDASHITIQQKELLGGIHKEPIGHVLCINGKFIEDKMIDDIYEFVNNHGMIHREQVFANAKHGYISYVSTLNETVFSYSNGKKKIPAVHLPPIVERLMKIVQKEILDVQFEYMKEQSECPDNLYQTVFNGVQVQVGDGFGSHSDRGPDTCYPDPDNNHSRDPRFPHVNEMQVVTIGFVFDKNGKLAGNIDAGCCDIVWVIKDAEDKSEEVAKIVTKQMFLHFQMHNIQSKCEHYVKQKRHRSAKNYVRVVLSFRYTLFARYIGDSYTRYSKVLDSTTSKSVSRVPILKDTGSPSCLALDAKDSHPPVTKAKFENACDDYKQIPPSLNTLTRACGTLTTPKDVAHYARCPEVARLLVGAGISMEIAYKDESIGSVPHYNELGTIGMSTGSSELRNVADIKSSSHHVNIATNDFRFLRDLIPEQAYKNSGKEIQTILKGVIGKSLAEIRSFYNSKSESEQEIWVGPSGGSLVKAGSTPMGMNQKEDTDAIAKTPSCMNPNCTEQRFIDAVRYRAVVVLHAPERWKDDIKSKSRSRNVVNLGLFYFHRCVIKIHEELCATDDGESFSDYYGEEGTWTFEQNPIYVLRPVFSKDHPMPEGYFTLTKSMEICEQPVVFDWENDIVSVGIDRTVLKNPRMDTVTCRRVLCDFVKDRLSRTGCTDTVDEVEIACGRNTRFFKCTNVQIKNEISRLAAASWHRLLQNNVYGFNNVGYVKELRIGWVHGMYAIPHPIRSYNVTTALLISTLGKHVDNFYPIRKRSTVKSKELLVDTIMAIIVVTTTGRLAIFQHYAKFLGAEMEACVPDTHNKLEEFFNFMRLKSGDEGRMCDYIGVLYQRSLMKKCTGTIKEYITFLKDCRKRLEQLFDEDEFSRWVNSVHSYNYYKERIGDVFESVGSNGTTKNGRPHFISHIVVSHMDEIFINDSVEEIDVELGYNGAHGPYLIDYGEVTKNNRDRWNVFAQFILDIIETACTEELDVWGLERVNNLVVVKINQRPIGLIDVECISCKLVATDERTNGSRLISMTPNLYQVYEWPQRIKLGLSTTILAGIGMIATRTFSTNALFETMDINDRYKFREETFKWTRYVSSVETDDNGISLSTDADKCNNRKKTCVTTVRLSKKPKKTTVDEKESKKRKQTTAGRRTSSRLQGNTISLRVI